jgi:endonuclease YncB( thermonuclease family)
MAKYIISISIGFVVCALSAFSQQETAPTGLFAKANQQWFGKASRPVVVSKVFDGDTIAVITRNYLTDTDTPVVIRAWRIDCPEVAHTKRGKNPAIPLQPGGEEAKAFLTDFIDTCGGKVVLATQGTDLYGRTLAEIGCKRPDGTALDYQTEVVKAGWSWVYVSAKKVPRADLDAAQQDAIANKRGIWGMSEKPVSPHEWRAKAKAEK